MPEYGAIRTQRGLPIGSIQPWGGPLSEIPSGWILANGAELVAKEYPLLARILKDTYGGNGFGGEFPGYSGSFILPQTNQKGLADISESNFDNNEEFPDGDLYTPPQRNTNIDDAESLAQVQQFIGEFGDLGFVSSTFSNTDLNFSYTPDPSGTVEAIDFDPDIASVAPDSLTSEEYTDVELNAFIEVNGQPLGTGGLGDGLSFTVVANAAVDGGGNLVPGSGTYSFGVINSGQGFAVGQKITILGNAFGKSSSAAGTSPENDLNLIIQSVGDSTFEGTIEGQSIIPGFGIREVFIVGRKLSANHFPAHTHGIPEGTAGYNTLPDDTDVPGNTGANRPGRGVGVIDTPEIAWDQIWPGDRECDAVPLEAFQLSNGLLFPECGDRPIGGGDGAPGDINFRIVGETGIAIIGDNESPGDPAELEVQPSPADTAENIGGLPYTQGDGRYAIGVVAGTIPFKTHKPRFTSRNSHGIGKSWFNDGAVKALSAGSGAFSDAASNWTSGPPWLNLLGSTGKLNPNDGLAKIPFSDDDSPITEPNFADTSTTEGANDIAVSIKNVLFNSNALNYNQIEPDVANNQNIVIEPHNHTGQINILYNGDAFRVPTRIVTKAQPFVTPDNIPNAFQIQFTNTPPSVSCIHLIRAY